MDAKEMVLEKLNTLGIEFELTDHAPVFTIADMEKEGITRLGDVCKNLFLRDDKGRRHFLVVLDKDKIADVKQLQKEIGCTRLSFASDERLFKYLQLKGGEVTPLGVINDSGHEVEVVVDADLEGKKRLGFHPNVNTATVWISFDDMKRFVEKNGNSFKTVKI